jgi:hypothetical protein
VPFKYPTNGHYIYLRMTRVLWWWVQMSTVRVGSQATLTMSEGGIKHAAAHDGTHSASQTTSLCYHPRSAEAKSQNT